MGYVFGTILLGAAGSIVAVIVIRQFEAGRSLLRRLFGLRYKVASILAEGGIQRMTLSRADYHRYRVGSGTLREYLATARNTIDIVSISLNVTQAEGALISLFEQKIGESDDFIVRITLLNPSSPVVPLLAKSLDIQPNELEQEIRDTLRQLTACRDRLPNDARRRLTVMIHDTLPIGSAILLDATRDGGRIQLETKLYRAPRTESFGFEVVGPTDFYRRNYTAWQRVFRDSVEWEQPLPMPPKSVNLSA